MKNNLSNLLKNSENTGNTGIYLDYQASTPLDARVLDKMLPFMTTEFGNLDTTFSVDKLNVIIGKNDVGKSTVIDALDVYFNDASIEPSDLNVYADPSETGSIEISCSFEVDPDERITLDSSENTATTLKAEYLLNKENLLEISKKYECSNGRIKKPVVQIVARHPKNFEKALICLKIQDLLKLANNKNISVPNRNVKKEIRRAIFEQYPNIEWVDDFLISIDSKDGDIIPVFSKFKDDFPAFLIFRADRTNTDKDKEVNDTTKAIAKAAVAELESKFSEIKKIVIEQIQALADKAFSSTKGCKIKEQECRLLFSVEGFLRKRFGSVWTRMRPEAVCGQARFGDNSVGKLRGIL